VRVLGPNILMALFFESGARANSEERREEEDKPLAETKPPLGIMPTP